MRRLVAAEHVIGKYADIDTLSIRLNPGEAAVVDVYATHLGKPLANETLEFFAHRQRLRDPDSVLGPIRPTKTS